MKLKQPRPPQVTTASGSRAAALVREKIAASVWTGPSRRKPLVPYCGSTPAQLSVKPVTCPLPTSCACGVLPGSCCSCRPCMIPLPLPAGGLLPRSPASGPNLLLPRSPLQPAARCLTAPARDSCGNPAVVAERCQTLQEFLQFLQEVL